MLSGAEQKQADTILTYSVRKVATNQIRKALSLVPLDPNHTDGRCHFVSSSVYGRLESRGKTVR
ncbi:hypothetical protein M378DRAFT_160991, partial [Amanita muscaria Koide BX008]